MVRAQYTFMNLAACRTYKTVSCYVDFHSALVKSSVETAEELEISPSFCAVFLIGIIFLESPTGC